MNLSFRIAEQKDLSKIFSMFKRSIMLMESQGIYQWDEIYPNEDILFEDISKKQLYICYMDNKFVSAFVLNKEYDKEYDSGDWKYTDGEYIIVHRLCVDSKLQNCGIGYASMSVAERIAKSMGAESLRLDCFSENPFALRLYRNLGYEVTGCANWRKGKFYLMEKSI